MSYGHLDVELGLEREGGEAISQDLLQLSRCGHPIFTSALVRYVTDTPLKQCLALFLTLFCRRQHFLDFN